MRIAIFTLMMVYWAAGASGQGQGPGKITSPPVPMADTKGSINYCEAGFVTLDSNKDGYLTLSELSEMTDQELAIIDRDNDRRVTPAEFTRCFELMGKEPKPRP